MEPSAASPAAVKFWEAVIARDRDAAIRNAESLVVPLVSRLEASRPLILKIPQGLGRQSNRVSW